MIIIYKILREIIWLFVWVTVADIILFGLPILKIVRKCKYKEYLIDAANRLEYQQGSECSGYSTAFVFRHLGIDIDGLSAYKQIPFKLLRGSVSGMGIVLLCLKYNVRVLLRIGNVEALKDLVSKGVPVVVLTRTGVGSRWLHYITVVGFDEEYIYTVDSMEEHVNSENTPYNRKISISDFKKTWMTSKIYQPLMFNLFFEMKR
ncbi:hypothetical protein [Butyrivibrio sp. AD3002]|uniref:hypothetical protein n=1 Tax=Butyrivibrio sp. AD3002 TaxID=1280670 RepID=UPI0003B3A0DA|nr:hypothetical protein [Butyrivibrio sp. AD3002]